MLWELIYPLVQLSILSLAVKLKGLIKSWKTCPELVLSHSERIGRNLFHLPNFLITIAINLVWSWLPLNSSTDDDVEFLNWSETGERQLFGPDMIKEAEEQVRI